MKKGDKVKVAEDKVPKGKFKNLGVGIVVDIKPDRFYPYFIQFKKLHFPLSFKVDELEKVK